MRRDRLLAALTLLSIAATPPLASLWMSGLATHVLVQLPLLIAGGALAAAAKQQRSAQFNVRKSDGAAALLLSFLCLSFWMLPRWLDAAVSDQRVNAVKVASLVLLAGLPLGWGWSRAGSVIRAFVWANAASMLAALGIIYLNLPGRLCSNYLLGEQAVLGRAMIIVAIMLIAFGSIRALTGSKLGRWALCQRPLLTTLGQ